MTSVVRSGHSVYSINASSKIIISDHRLLVTQLERYLPPVRLRANNTRSIRLCGFGLFFQSLRNYTTSQIRSVCYSSQLLALSTCLIRCYEMRRRNPRLGYVASIVLSTYSSRRENHASSYHRWITTFNNCLFVDLPPNDRDYHRRVVIDETPGFRRRFTVRTLANRYFLSSARCTLQYQHIPPLPPDS